MIKKRGFVEVIIVLLFVFNVWFVETSDDRIRCSGSNLASCNQNGNGLQCQGIQIINELDDGFYNTGNDIVNIEETDDSSCRDDRGGPNPGWGWIDTENCEDDRGGDIEQLPPPPPLQSDIGFYFSLTENDGGGGDDDECSYGLLPYGHRFYRDQSEAERLPAFTQNYYGDDDSCEPDDNDNCGTNNFLQLRFYIDPGGICAMDKFWYTCSEDINGFGKDETTINAKMQTLRQRIST